MTMQGTTRWLLCGLFWTITASAQTVSSEVWANHLNPDIGTALKLAVLGFGSTGGTARIACGAYSTSVGDIVINYANISVEGQNSNCVFITYTGTTDFIRVQMKPFTVAQAGKISGFTIRCAGACQRTDKPIAGIHLGDVIGMHLDDVVVGEFIARNESGVWLDNTLGWMERTVMSRVWSDRNTKAFRVSNSSGGRQHSSFGYSRMLDVRCNIFADQTCLSFEGGRFYHSSVNLIANSGAVNSTLIAVSGVQFKNGPGTSVDSSQFQVTGESPPGAINLNVAANTFFNTCGFISYPGTKSIIEGTVNSFLCYQTTGSYSGLYSNGAQLIAGQPRRPLTTVSPEFNGVGGFLNNGWFNGKGWQFNTNGKDNGGTGFLGSSSEVATFYAIPTNETPDSPQEIASTGLKNYKVAGFDHRDWIFYRGIASEGAGAKHRRFAATCTTGADAGSRCTTTYSWKVAFEDSNFTPVCWGAGASGSPILSLVSQDSESITIQIQAATATKSGFRGIDCVAIHD